MSEETAKKKRLAFLLNADLHRAFKSICAVNGREMAEVLIELVSLYVDTERAAVQQSISKSLTYKPFRTDADADRRLI